MRRSDLRRAAVIDVGTNSIKLAVGELNKTGEFRQVADKSVVARLGANVDRTGRLNRAAQDRAMRTIRLHLLTARKLKAQVVRAVATSALRDASNSGLFVERVKSELGIDLEILSGEREGQLAYAAVALDPAINIDVTHLLVVDIGGGSTELVFGSGTEVSATFSVDIGAVRLTERYVKSDPPRIQDVAAVASAAESSLISSVALTDRWATTPASVVAVGGTAVNLARMRLGVPADSITGIHGSRITTADVDHLLGMLCRMDLVTRREVVGLDPDRADVIIAGAIIIRSVMAVMNVPEVVVSVRGLRYGLLYETLRSENWRSIISS